VKESEDHHRQPRVRAKSEQSIESTHVLERLVDDRHPDDGVYHIRVRVDASEHAGEQSDAVADREQADVLDDILQSVEEENHPSW